MFPTWLRVGIAAAWQSLRPRRGSTRLARYARRTHIEIEREEPFRCVLNPRWEAVCRPLTVDDEERIAGLQYTARTALAQANEDAKSSEARKRLVAENVKLQFYRLLVALLMDLTSEHYRGFFERRAYRRFLAKELHRNVAAGVRMWDSLLDYNSRLDSFFFEGPKLVRREAYARPRDALRATRFGGSDGRRGQCLLQATVLEIYSRIVYTYEEEQLALEREALTRAEGHAD